MAVLSRRRIVHIPTDWPVLRCCLSALALFVLLTVVPTAHAETIPLRSAELRVDNDTVVFNADYGLEFTSSLEEALQRGVPLYFVFEWKVTYARWYWFDKSVLEGETRYRLDYQPLTRHYRLSTGALAQDVTSTEEAERLIGRITSWPLFPRDALEAGKRYTFEARLRLDTERMPKPFQITAFGSRDWALSSVWHTLDFQP